MRSNIFSIFCITAAVGALTACSTRTVAPTPDYSVVPAIPELTSPAPGNQFAFDLPRGEMKPYEIPDIRISETFSATETNHVRASDNNLFAKKSQITIDFNAVENSEFAFPLPGGKVISPYAGRRKNHTGVDIKTRANDTIVSAFDGIVRMSKPYSSYGNVVVVRHYNGLETVYSHNSKNLVKPGDRVKAGTPIALTGRTGRATTEHLHFETRINGQHFDPSAIIDFSDRTLKKNQWVVSLEKSGKVTVTPAAPANQAG